MCSIKFLDLLLHELGNPSSHPAFLFCSTFKYSSMVNTTIQPHPSPPVPQQTSQDTSFEVQILDSAEAGMKNCAQLCTEVSEHAAHCQEQVPLVHW